MKDVVISFKAEEDIRDRLKELAAKRDVPVSQIIRDAIKQYFKEAENNG